MTRRRTKKPRQSGNEDAASVERNAMKRIMTMSMRNFLAHGKTGRKAKSTGRKEKVLPQGKDPLRRCLMAKTYKQMSN